jgi:autotransporter-associated beta strand protein
VAHDGALMFTGSISGTYVYGAALTAAQIQALYLAGPSSVYGSLPSTTALSITSSGAALDLDGGQQTVASLSGVAGASVYLGGGTLTVTNSGSTTFAGSIRDSGGAGSGVVGGLIVTGSGTLVLGGTNSYVGGTSVEGNARLILTNPRAMEDDSNLYVGTAVAAFTPIMPQAAVTSVPEPATLTLLVTGAVLTSIALRRRKRLARFGSGEPAAQ